MRKKPTAAGVLAPLVRTSLTGCVGLLMVIASAGARFASEEYAYHHENVMGTALELRVLAGNEAAARLAEKRVLAEIDRCSAILSGYDPRSEFSLWQATANDPAIVSAELFEMLRAAERWQSLSGGAFDARVEALSRLWSVSAKQGHAPNIEEIARTLEGMQSAVWRLDKTARTAARASNCPISLNAIAKGYILDRACTVAMERGYGISGVLLNVGGDIRAVGAHDWSIGMAPAKGDSESAQPALSIRARNCSVATSGNAHRGFRIKERWYSHILDPRTGQPVSEVIAATVIAPSGTDADALATICNVLPVEESLRLVESLPEAACLIVSSDGRVIRSVRWRRHELRSIPQDFFALTQNASWPKSQRGEGEAPGSVVEDLATGPCELAVHFEINEPETRGGRGRYRRPYVVVWIEDERAVAVRTLILWVSLGGSGPDRWLPDLNRWYRGDKLHDSIDRKNMVQTIARSTRPPGKYTVVWDGKDDQGKPVASGRYTVSIEAAREHGTHQLMRKEVNLSDQPFIEELKGNVELKSATIEYRRKSDSK